MEYAAELMGESGLKYTYGEVYEVVKDFDCGVFFEPEFLAANPQEVLPNIVSTKTHSVLPESWLHSGSKKSVISRSAGYDHFEHLSQIANITSLREYCVNAVAETAIKMMFSVCGNLNQYTANTARFERDKCISFKELTGLKVTVFGCGKIGKRIYDMVAGLGMDARAVDIRAEELSRLYGGSVRFISAEEASSVMARMSANRRSRCFMGIPPCLCRKKGSKKGVEDPHVLRA